MNKIILVGRFIKDPELMHIQNENKVYTKFIIAVDRLFKDLDGTRKADLIPVIIWGKKAEVICKYMKKGSCISLSGRLKTGSYENKEGNKRYTAEVIGEDFKFIGNKKEENYINENVNQ
ncbi:single-stranded DNA-binding protein [Clostridium uliginosum]|uniref:Single-stranded DNA-binding protein n=1 Tax=Clostridium uliginosum TaxID=119641 RepID=A0A1I1QPJ3_9CLOT|nr:single-stranded DNA-binding protein [Clostridium uliginosum]SFD21203.1 single-strand DNA-binding protein [Clostridium uliginosum]